MSVDNKTCTGCRETKPATREFWTPNQGSRGGWRSQCKLCTNAKGRVRSQRWGKKWHANRRNGWLKRKYGITLSDYERLLKAQGGVCLICHSPESRKDGQLHLSVDHDHQTGQVRGLLCVRCNTLVGLLETLGPHSKIAWNAMLYIKGCRRIEFMEAVPSRLEASMVGFPEDRGQSQHDQPSDGVDQQRP